MLARIQTSPSIVTGIFFCLLGIALMLPSGSAYADSPPPPSYVWFTFDYQMAHPPKFLGLQLVGCETESCDNPVLLQQFGTCNSAGCLTSAPTLEGYSNEFGCADNKCRSTAFPSHGGTDFRLVAQFSDRIRTSPVTGQLPSGYADTLAWTVMVSDADLSIEPGTVPEVPDLYPKNVFEQFGLSILVELLVAAVCFQVGTRTDFRNLLSRLLLIFWINLLTLPVVWYFFPSLGYFHSDAGAMMGVGVLLVAIFYAGGLTGIYWTQKKTRKWIIALTVISLPLVFVLCLACGLITGYANRSVTAPGLSATQIIIASEAFAVLAEAFMLALLSKRSISLKLVFLTSFLMNAASFLLGLFMNWIL